MLERFKEISSKLIESVPIVVGGVIVAVGFIVTSPLWIPVFCITRFLQYTGMDVDY